MDSEMETKETDEYENITICISKPILDQVRKEALAIGVSVYDMIRFTLGERFKSIASSQPEMFRELMAMSAL